METGGQNPANSATWGIRLSWIFLVLAIGVVLFQAGSFVHRASTGQTDFSVYYRTAQLMVQGATGAIYEGMDPQTGWYRCIPPAGLSLVAWLTVFPVGVAATIWAVINLGLAAFGARLLHLAAEAWQGGAEDSVLTRWAVVVWLVLVSAGIQVGQMTALFLVCWMGGLVLWANSKRGWAGFLFVTPTLAKLYPALLFAGFLRARSGKFWLGAVAGLVVLGGLIPALFARDRTLDLSSAFLRETVLSPAGRVATFTNPHGNNWSLDAAFVSAFGYESPRPPEPGREPAMTDLAPPWVMALALVLKVVILGFAMARSWSLGPSLEPNRLWSQLALWSATLYLVLPENKARYAAYVLPALLPWLVAISRSRQRQIGQSILVGGVVLALVVVTPISDMGLALAATVWVWLCQWRYGGGQKAVQPSPVGEG